MTTRVTINKDSSEHNIVVRTRRPTDTVGTPVQEETIYDDGGTEFLLHSGMVLDIREVEKSEPVDPFQESIEKSAKEYSDKVDEESFDKFVSVDDEDDTGLI